MMKEKEFDGWYVLDNRAYRGEIKAVASEDSLSLAISNLMICIDIDDLLELIEGARADRVKS